MAENDSREFATETEQLIYYLLGDADGREVLENALLILQSNNKDIESDTDVS